MVRKYYENLRVNKQKGSGEETKGARPKETAKQQGIGGREEHSKNNPEQAQTQVYQQAKLRTARKQEYDENRYTSEHSRLKEEQRHAAWNKYKEEVRKTKGGSKDDNNNGKEGAEHKTADNPIPKTTRDTKKKEYREYLQETGVLDHITNSLVRLAKEQEKPTDARRYMEEAMSGSQDNKEVITRLKQQNDRLKEKEKEMEADKANLERRLRTLQDRSHKEQHKVHPMERLKTHKVNLPTGHPFSQKEEHKGHHMKSLQTHRVNLPTGHPFKSKGGTRRPEHKGTDTDGQSQDTRKQGGEKRDEERSGREREGTDSPTM